MHIDHSKLVELLAEATGTDQDKVEKQLEELVAEIDGAIQEGEAYEVEGLGVFSSIGNNIIFIPSDDFATEINYKYVGMEPIDIDRPSSDKAEAQPEETKSAPKDVPDSDENEDEDDPFAGLLDDEDEDETAAIDDSSLEPDKADEKPLDDPDPESIDDFADAEEDAPFELADESPVDEAKEDTEEQEYKPGPDKWGIDTYKDDADASMFSGLLGDSKEDASANNLEEAADEEEGDDDTEDLDLAAALGKKLKDEDDEEDSFDALFGDADVEEEFNTGEASIEPDDEIEFLDPFAELARDEESMDEEEKEADDEQEEVVPVIKNLASEEAKQKRAKEESKKKKKEKEKDTDSANKKMPPKAKSDSKGAPVLLWVLLIMIILAGGTYSLGYFGIVNIPGISPSTPVATSQPSVNTPTPSPQQSVNQPETRVQQTPAPAQQQPAQQQTPAQPPANQEADQAQETPQQSAGEQPTQNQVSQDNPVPDNQPRYGLRGTANPAANNGFTIVVYSLSDESNARAKQEELNREGYRALVVAIPSQRYGQLWRVSLGQFETLRAAAIAAETLETPYSENYFITSIN